MSMLSYSVVARFQTTPRGVSHVGIQFLSVYAFCRSDHSFDAFSKVYDLKALFVLLKRNCRLFSLQ